MVTATPSRRDVLTLALAAAATGLAPRLAAASDEARGIEVLGTWYRLVLELVRHTPTYSPPVASRMFAYVGVTAFEVIATGNPALNSLAGQLNGLTQTPARGDGAHDDAVALDAALSVAVNAHFFNTGPTGQKALSTISKRLAARAAEGVPADVVARSIDHGQKVARHLLNWAATDGGAVIENMGFPLTYVPAASPAAWVPTNVIRQQQAPLLPAWGDNRPFAMPAGSTCDIPPPPAYDETPGSAFYKEALEVYETVKGLTPEQKKIARFWADDAMLSPTPPGHWISIARQILDVDKADLARRTEVLAVLGVALGDAFIACWHEKRRYNLLRPITYIRKHIDPAFEPLLNTPPFPEYPSGHSTQSGAAAVVMTQLFGDDRAFDDATHIDDGIAARSFPSFQAAAEEAAISRLYGGIHYRAAIRSGLAQGQCTGGYAAALQTRK